MSRSNSLEEVPFNRETGKPMPWVGNRRWSGVEWRPNEPFDAVMVVTRMDRGRSSALFVLTDLRTSVEYPVFMTDMLEILQERQINHGKVRGTWRFRKRGQNYALALA